MSETQNQAPTGTQTTTAAAAKTEKQVETVKMTDGRQVDFPGKRQLVKDSFEQNGKVATRLDFRNGETRTFVIPDALLSKFAAHGAEQKLGDEIAGLKDLDDAVMAVDKLIERLNAGQWNMERDASGMAGTSVLARALAEFRGVDIAKIKEWLKDKSQAEKVAMRNNPKIKPIIEKIEAEKAEKGAKVDTEALLADMPT